MRAFHEQSRMNGFAAKATPDKIPCLCKNLHVRLLKKLLFSDWS